eukprot:5381058-Alexandrium_andersonii.AAC.1
MSPLHPCLRASRVRAIHLSSATLQALGPVGQQVGQGRPLAFDDPGRQQLQAQQRRPRSAYGEEEGQGEG